MKIFSTLLIITIFFTTAVLISRSFRVDKIPNGNKFMCANCHTNPAGGSTRNSFGKDVEARVTPNGFQDFWDSQLASLDSDGDGFSNGVELQDPNGTWRPGQPNPGNSNLVSNPGDPNSKPNISSVEFSEHISDYKLLNNYPNPFNPSTNIAFEIPQIEFVTLKIFNINGELIKTLVSQNLSAGRYEKVWDGKNEKGEDVSTGIYLYQLNAGHFSKANRMILLR